MSRDRVRLTTEIERAGWQVAVHHYQAARRARRPTRLVPYCESGAEPWASTGYGALVPDPLSAVQRRGQR